MRDKTMCNEENAASRDDVENAGFMRVVSDILAQMRTLMSEELHLVKTEAGSILAEHARLLVCFLVAAAFALIAALLACQSAVFGLIAAGLAPYAAGLVVTAATAVAAVILFLVARARLAASLERLASGKRLDGLKTALRRNATERKNKMVRHAATSGRDVVRGYVDAAGEGLAKVSRDPLIAGLTALAVVVAAALAIWSTDEGRTDEE